MNTKIQKQYIDMGFGFPVYLLNVPMIKVRGHWTPKINYNELSDLLLTALAEKPSKLTGCELKFIRTKLEMKLADFAEKFYVTHPAVLKWEHKKDEITGMNWATEKDIRLFIFSSLSSKSEFPKRYQQLRQEASEKKIITKIDIHTTENLLLV